MHFVPELLRRAIFSFHLPSLEGEHAKENTINDNQFHPTEEIQKNGRGQWQNVHVMAANGFKP